MQRSCWWSQSPLRRTCCHKWPSRWKLMINTDSEVALENGLRLSKRISSYTLTANKFGAWLQCLWLLVLFRVRSGSDVWVESLGARSAVQLRVWWIRAPGFVQGQSCASKTSWKWNCLASCMLHADTTCKQLPQISKRFNEPTDWRLCFVDSIKKNSKSFKSFYIEKEKVCLNVPGI